MSQRAIERAIFTDNPRLSARSFPSSVPIGGHQPLCAARPGCPPMVLPLWPKPIGLRSLVNTARPVHRPSGQRQPGPRCSPQSRALGAKCRTSLNPQPCESQRAIASLTPHPILVEISATSRVSPRSFLSIGTTTGEDHTPSNRLWPLLRRHPRDPGHLGRTTASAKLRGIARGGRRHSDRGRSSTGVVAPCDTSATTAGTECGWHP